MADERLRKLEREAEAGDPEARQAWLRELIRLRDPRYVNVEELEATIQEELDALRAGLEEVIALEVSDAQRRGRVRELTAASLRPVVRSALDWEEQGFGLGFKQLAKIWPSGRSNWDEIDEFEQLDDPFSVWAFCARLDDEVVLRVGWCASRKPTPGTTWSQLSPWRLNLTPKTWRKRLRSWIDGGHASTGLEWRRDVIAPSETFRTTVAEARLWIDLVSVDDAEGDETPRRVVNLDAPSEKQLKFITSLKRKKHLSDDAFSAFLQKWAGVRLLDYLGRSDASTVIDALLKLPDPPKGSKPPRERKTARKKTKTAAKKAPGAGKVAWEGKLVAVQPRIKLSRMGGEEQHGYQGYTLRLEGTVDGEARAFSVGIGKAAQKKHGFQAGDTVRGAAAPVAAGTHEATDFYKASKLELVASDPPAPGEPPWLGPPPELPDYRARGHREIGEDAFNAEPCRSCIWGCLMPAEDREDGTRTLETHCYGPRDCSGYQPF